MLRITPSKSAAGAAKYFDEGLAQADYYAKDEQILGQWGGKAAERLGLEGDVKREDFTALCHNRKPDGNKLNPRDSAKRKSGYDFTFSAPKSVSVAYSITGDERIRGAFEHAVETTMREIEQEMRTQRGQGTDKQHVKTGNMVWGRFTHRTSRPVDGIPDCHLHAHAYAFNTTWSEEKQRFQAGEFRAIKERAPYYQAAFDARLAINLRQLGYQIETRGLSFELKGIEQGTLDKFSRRTREIEATAKAEAETNGFLTAKQKDKLGARTRLRKLAGMSYDKLREIWNSWLKPEEGDSVMSAHRQPGPELKGDRQVRAREAVDSAVAHLFERKSAVEETQLMGEALRRGYGEVLPEDIRQAMKQSNFYRQEQRGKVWLTTEGAVKDEKAMIRYVRQGRGRCDPLNPHYQPKADYLNPEQKAAITHALTSIDRVSIIAGGAGTGKTTLMKEVRSGIEASGKQLFGFAPSAAASRGVMREEGFDKADTLARLLVDKKLQEQVKGQVIWVDEAGLIGNKDMNRLFEVAEQQQARLLLTGDIRQHSAVAAGDALRILEERGGIKVARVNEIQRQRKNERYKAVVKLVSEDRVEQAVGALDRMGGVVEIADEQQRLERLVQDYAQAKQEGKTALVVSPVHKEANHVTNAIRERLKQDGELGTEERSLVVQKNLNFTLEQRRQLDRMPPEGMSIEFHQNAPGFRKGERWQVLPSEEAQIHSLKARHADGRELRVPLEVAERFTVYREDRLKLAHGDRIRITKGGTTMDGKRINNGDLFTVAGFSKEGHIRLDNGRVLRQDFGHLAHGYVTTSHSSQGKTVDRVFIAQSEMSRPASSKQQFYVSISRGKEMARVYTDDKAALQRAVLQDGRRMTASEIADQQRMMRTQQQLKRAQATRHKTPNHARRSTPDRTRER